MKRIILSLILICVLYPSCTYLKVGKMRKKAQEAFTNGDYTLARKIYDEIKGVDILYYYPEDEYNWERSVLQIAINNYKTGDFSSAYYDFQMLEGASRETAMWANYYLALLTISNSKDLAFNYLYDSILAGIDTDILYNNERLLGLINSYCVNMTVEDVLKNNDIAVESSIESIYKTNFELFRIACDLNNDGIEEIIVLSGLPHFNPYPNYAYCRLLIYQYESSSNKFLLKLKEDIELSEVLRNSILRLPNNGEMLSEWAYYIDLNGDSNNELLLPIGSYAGPGGSNKTLFIIGYCDNNFQIIRLHGKIKYMFEDSPYLIHYPDLYSDKESIAYYLDSTYKLVKIRK